MNGSQEKSSLLPHPRIIHFTGFGLADVGHGKVDDQGPRRDHRLAPGGKSASFVEVWRPFLWENHWEKKTPKNGAVFCVKIMKNLREIVNIAMLKITVAASNFV